MKLIIAGGRKYRFSKADVDRLNHLYRTRDIEEVVSGCAPGADTYGAQWAEILAIEVKPFPADWEDLSHPDALIRTRYDGTKYDARAGFRRNEQMAQYADAVVLFPGGSGTFDMWQRAEAHDLEIFDWRNG